MAGDEPASGWGDRWRHQARPWRLGPADAAPQRLRCGTRGAALPRRPRGDRPAVHRGAVLYTMVVVAVVVVAVVVLALALALALAVALALALAFDVCVCKCCDLL